MELRDYIRRYHQAFIPRDDQTLSTVEDIVQDQMFRAIREMNAGRIGNAYVYLKRSVVMYGILEISDIF